MYISIFVTATNEKLYNITLLSYRYFTEVTSSAASTQRRRKLLVLKTVLEINTFNTSPSIVLYCNKPAQWRHHIYYLSLGCWHLHNPVQPFKIKSLSWIFKHHSRTQQSHSDKFLRGNYVTKRNAFNNSKYAFYGKGDHYEEFQNKTCLRYITLFLFHIEFGCLQLQSQQWWQQTETIGC